MCYSEFYAVIQIPFCSSASNTESAIHRKQKESGFICKGQILPVLLGPFPVLPGEVGPLNLVTIGQFRLVYHTAGSVTIFQQPHVHILPPDIDVYAVPPLVPKETCRCQTVLTCQHQQSTVVSFCRQSWTTSGPFRTKSATLAILLQDPVNGLLSDPELSCYGLLHDSLSPKSQYLIA